MINFLKNNKYINYILNIKLNIIFIVASVLLATIMNMGNSKKQILFAVFITLIVTSVYCIYKKNLFKDAISNLLSNKLKTILSILFSLIIAKQFFLIEYDYIIRIVNYTYKFLPQIHLFYTFILLSFSLLIFFEFYVIIQHLFKRYCNQIINFFKGLNINERKFLIIANVIIILTIFIVYNMTNLFYIPKENITGRIGVYDILYTSDTGFLVKNNVFMHNKCPENDIRQPLYAIFSFPFGAIAKEISSNILFAVPHAYEISIASIQSILLVISIICISRLIKINDKLKQLYRIAFLGMYSSMLFILNMEQYMFAIFWLIIFIYNYMLNSSKDKLSDLYIAATGSLLTSGILIPLMVNFKKLKNSIINIFNTFLKFSFLIIFSGKFKMFINVVLHPNIYDKYMGKEIGLYNKIIQFTYYIKSCFIKPETEILKDENRFITYQLQNHNTLSYLGIILFLIIVVSFIINYKEKFSRILGFWTIFSIILLVFIGWGTTENGLILYTLYFTFAYLALLFLFINKIYIKYPKLTSIFILFTLIIIIILNIYSILDVVKFGIVNYPVS